MGGCQTVANDGQVQHLQIEGSIGNTCFKPDYFIRHDAGAFALVQSRLILITIVIITPRWPRPRRPDLYLFICILDGNNRLLVMLAIALVV